MRNLCGKVKGFTLIEVIITVAISGLILGVLGSAIGLFLKTPPQTSDKLEAVRDLDQATLWLTNDSQQAESFTILSSPQYGRFQWQDRSAAPVVAYSITYYYDSTNGRLVREEQRDSVVTSTTALARHIAAESDVSFQYTASTYSLTVVITSTVEGTGSIATTTLSRTITTALRPRTDPVVSAPGATPVPTPAPGATTYYVAANPTVLSGTYSSGNAASLNSSDADYYVVDSTGGGIKEAIWWVESQTMTTPATIANIQVRFTGKTDKNNTAMQFYVQDPATGNFSSTPASGFTFTEVDTDRTHFFYLDATVVSYINQPGVRKVKLKVEASANATFTLSTNQVLFIAEP